MANLFFNPHLLRRLEFVADFAESVNKSGIVRVGFDFVSQGGHESVDASGGNESAIAPDGI